jgi:hypothetical protein
MSNYCQHPECDDCRSEELAEQEMFITNEMANNELEKIDHARSIKHLPIDSLKDLGKVSETALPPAADPFTCEGDDLYSLSPYAHLFEQADEVVNATPEGGIIEMDLIVEEREQ